MNTIWSWRETNMKNNAVRSRRCQRSTSRINQKDTYALTYIMFLHCIKAAHHPISLKTFFKINICVGSFKKKNVCNELINIILRQAIFTTSQFCLHQSCCSPHAKLWHTGLEIKTKNNMWHAMVSHHNNMMLSLCFTFQISGSVGIFWKNSPEVGDRGDSHRHHPLDKHKGLLFCFMFVQKQAYPLQDIPTKGGKQMEKPYCRDSEATHDGAVIHGKHDRPQKIS